MDPRTTIRAHPVAVPSGDRRPRRDGVPERIDEDRKSMTLHAVGRPLPPGTAVGRYIVHKVIGRGGMGIVYGAVDPTLGRRVALKLVRDGRRRPSARFRERLQREALALARVSHPNIVSIFDIGTTDHGTFVAMEYVRGIDLRRWLRGCARSVDEILQVFTAAGEGLAAAHAEGLVHRDFKPTNVMVTPDQRVKVLDFGLARGRASTDPWLDATDGPLLARRLTLADTVVGTTGYMPPEQLLGREVSPASDQFAFCVALYEALHGVRPFPGTNPVEQARAYARGHRTPNRARRDVSSSMLAVIERGMALEAADRFEGMRPLLDALHRVQTPSRRRAALMMAGLVVATALASSAMTAWLRPDVAGVCAPRRTAPAALVKP